MSSPDLLAGADGHGSEDKPRRARSRFIPVVHWLWDIVIAVILAVVTITFAYQPVRVEGTSMTPMLTDQERIFVNKFIYKFSSIDRGDIVVFQYPLDPRKSFIKRVVGLPGEAVEMKDGTVYVNGEPLREDYLSNAGLDDSSFPRLRLPTGHYFVLGDQRENSNDSRAWGTVPRSHIYGKAVFAYWPLDRFGPIEQPGAAGEGSETRQ